jgi:hypothetical protein
VGERESGRILFWGLSGLCQQRGAGQLATVCGESVRAKGIGSRARIALVCQGSRGEAYGEGTWKGVAGRLAGRIPTPRPPGV